jgi:hypothetical protein
MEPIRQREDPQRRLLNTVEISDVEIPPAAEGEDASVWGVALWRDIDPATDRFAIYIKGLTNAYRIKTDEEGNWQGYSRKTLQLNFWRPGDEFFEHESEIRFGSPPQGDARQQASWRSEMEGLRKKAIGAPAGAGDMAAGANDQVGPPPKGLTSQEEARLAELEMLLGVDYRWVYW